MKLLHDVTTARGFSACLFLTYNLDLAWFERLIARQLRAHGVRHFLILADGARLSETLEDQVSLLSEVGRSYAVLGMAPPCFHPKALLLTGERAARLYVGSGNLTHAGYGRNREIFESWDVADSDATVPMAFERLRIFVEEAVHLRTAGRPPEAIQAVLDAVFGAPALQKPLDEEATRELLASPGGLLGRLPQPPSATTSLTLVAPSFDREGTLVLDLVERLGAVRFEVVTDPRTTNLTREALEAIEAKGGTFSRFDDERRLHAKILDARGDGWHFSATGSANLSHAAWRGRNAELLVVRRDAAATAVAALLDAVPRVPLSENDRTRLPEWTEIDRTAARGPEILDARWVGERQIRLRPLASAGHFDVQLCTEEGPRAVSRTVADGDEVVITPPDDCQRGRAYAVRLVDSTGEGPWCAVHDVQELNERGQQHSRAAESLGGLLADEGAYDAAAAEKLLELLTSHWRRRLEASRQQPEHEPDEQADVQPVKPNWIWVRDDEFTSPNGAPNNAVPESADSRVTLPALLLRRLLFGPSDDPDMDDRGEGESGGGDDDNGEIESSLPPPTSIRPPPSRPRGAMESFTASAHRALEQYLKLLRTGTTRSAGRLLEDMQILVGTLHYGLRAGALSVIGFREQMIKLLRTFLGRRRAPFPAALERIASSDREDAWRRAPLLTFVALTIYNLALTELAVSSSEDPPGAVVRSKGLVLWARHLVSRAPVSVLQEVLERLAVDARRARRGDLWLQPLELVAQTLPFEAFAAELLRGARDVEALEQAISSRLRATAPSPLLIDGDAVVGFGRDGALAIGHVERVGHGLRAYLYDGAYQQPDAEPDSLWESMYVVGATQSIAALEEVHDWCEELGEESGTGLRALVEVR